jgi:hypothetical protein
MVSIKQLYGHMATKKLKISLELDAKFKELAESLPPMQIEIAGIKQTFKGQPLFVNHHAEILCRYAQNNRKKGAKAVQEYVNGVMEKHKIHSAKLRIV